MLTTSHIQAPAGLFCDASSGRRTGISARGYVRCPILDPVQDLPGERSNALPGIMVLPAGHVPPANFLRLGFGRARAFISAHTGQLGKVIRFAPHVSVSVSNFQVPTCWHEGGSLWRKVEPRSRQKNPRAGTQVM